MTATAAAATTNTHTSNITTERKMSYISWNKSLVLSWVCVLYIESIEASFRFILLDFFYSFHFIIDIADANTYNYIFICCCVLEGREHSCFSVFAENEFFLLFFSKNILSMYWCAHVCVWWANERTIELNWVELYALSRRNDFFLFHFTNTMKLLVGAPIPYTQKKKSMKQSKQASKRPIDQPTNGEKKPNAIKYISKARMKEKKSNNAYMQSSRQNERNNEKKTCASLRINYFTLGIQCTHKYKSLNRLCLCRRHHYRIAHIVFFSLLFFASFLICPCVSEYIHSHNVFFVHRIFYSMYNFYFVNVIYLRYAIKMRLSNGNEEKKTKTNQCSRKRDSNEKAKSTKWTPTNQK